MSSNSNVQLICDAHTGEVQDSYIPYGCQDISQADIQAVVEVLQSPLITQGPVTEKFESAVAACCQSRFAVSTNSATSALHIACLALDVGPGDIVWTTPVSFVASANCALYCGAGIDFVDIDPVSCNMGIDALANKLHKASRRGNLPKVVIPVHLSGNPCDMSAIKRLSDQYGFSVIEDASHAIGASQDGQPVGSCRYSDITVFSFHPVKVITSGEGGMAVTNSHKLADRMQRLRNHGITRDEDCMTRSPDGPWYYQQIELGYNYRLTDIHAALGLSQLARLQEFVQRRRQIAEIYNDKLFSLPLMLPDTVPLQDSSWHLYIVRLDDEIHQHQKDVFEYMRETGIGVNLHYIPIHTQPYFLDKGFQPGQFPEAEKYYRRAISLPIYPGLSSQQQNRVCERLREAIQLCA